MSNNIKYPETMPFRFSGFDWQIKFLDIETENFGITDTDKKIVHIYYRGKDDQNVIETLIHELSHVVMFELADSIFKHESEKSCDLEENMIRLTSPRVFALLRDNVELMEFIVKRIKKLWTTNQKKN